MSDVSDEDATRMRVRMSRVSARMSRGCCEKRAPVEFKLSAVCRGLILHKKRIVSDLTHMEYDLTANATPPTLLTRLYQPLPYTDQ